MAEHPLGLEKVLDDSALHVCKALSGSPLSRTFYLAGGTGLALQLRHRVSLDLDFFTISPNERLDSALVSSSLERLFSGQTLSLEMSQVDQSTWTVGSTKTSFVAYPFPLMDAPIQGGAVAEGLAGLQLASVRDIACMKAYALGRRATYRDYVDLYFILKETDLALDSLMADCARKFVMVGERLFSARLFLEQLVYTEDIEDRDVTLRLLLGQKDLTAGEIDRYLREKVDRFLQNEVDTSGGDTP